MTGHSYASYMHRVQTYMYQSSSFQTGSFEIFRGLYEKENNNIEEKDSNSLQKKKIKAVVSSGLLRPRLLRTSCIFVGLLSTRNISFEILRCIEEMYQGFLESLVCKSRDDFEIFSLTTFDSFTLEVVGKKQPRSQALSSLERKTLVGSGHVAPRLWVVTSK